MIYIDHLRHFIGAERQQFRGKKDATLALAGLVADNKGRLTLSALRTIIGPPLTNGLVLAVATKPAYERITQQHKTD